MKLFRAWGVSACLVSVGIGASEHPACQNIDFPYRDITPDRLHGIARSCAAPQITALYHYRARHAELMAEHAVMSRLEQVQRSSSDWTASEDALFIALVETLSATYDLSPAARAEIINAAFSHTNELAELRLRGYDLQATRLREEGITGR